MTRQGYQISIRGELPANLVELVSAAHAAAIAARVAHPSPGEPGEEEGARPGPGSDGRAQQQQSAAVVSRRPPLHGSMPAGGRPAAVAVVAGEVVRW